MNKSSVAGWKEYKYYLIGQWKETGDRFYRKETRKVDKIINKLREDRNEQKMDISRDNVFKK